MWTLDYRADLRVDRRLKMIAYVETAKSNNLEPYAYILHILNHIGAADTLEKIEALLPWNVPQDITQK